ncbi:MAG: GNAT family N-acetyltransferase [Pseudomonadota bacterium]
MTPQLRPARPDETGKIIDFLHTFMKSSWKRKRWERVFDQRWVRPERGPPDLGHVVAEGDKILGYCGLVNADRRIDGRWERTGSVGSLYLHKSLRGQGLGKALMVNACASPGVTITVIGTGDGSRPLMGPAGCKLLDRDRFIWRRQGVAPPKGVRVMTDLAEIGPLLDDDQSQMLTDHDGLGVVPVMLDSPDGRCLAVFWVQIKGEDVTYWDAVHVANGSVFAAYGQALADALLPNDAASILTADRRYLPVDAKGEVEVFGDNYWYKSATLDRTQVDLMYNEILLLKLKLS